MLLDLYHPNPDADSHLPDTREETATIGDIVPEYSSSTVLAQNEAYNVKEDVTAEPEEVSPPAEAKVPEPTVDHPVAKASGAVAVRETATTTDVVVPDTKPTPPPVRAEKDEEDQDRPVAATPVPATGNPTDRVVVTSAKPDTATTTGGGSGKDGGDKYTGGGGHGEGEDEDKDGENHEDRGEREEEEGGEGEREEDRKFDEFMKSELAAAAARHEAHLGGMTKEIRLSITGPDRAIEESNEYEEPPEQAYSRFRPIIDELKARAVRIWSDAESSRVLDFRIGDPLDITRTENLMVRFIPEHDEPLRVTEMRRYEALVCGISMNASVSQVNFDRLVAYDPVTGYMVIRDAPGKELATLTADDKREIGFSNLADLLRGLEGMNARRVMPNTRFGSSVVWDATTHRFGIRDYIPIESDPVNQESIVYTTVRAFDGVVRELRGRNSSDKKMIRLDSRFHELSRAVLRDHLLYVAPSIAKATEKLQPDEIRVVYEHILPRQEGMTRRAYVASEMHDLALSRTSGAHDAAASGEGNITQRLAMLDEAREAYKGVVYRRVVDPRDGSILYGARVDRLLVTRNSFIQARLALAYMPISAARIRNEQPSPADLAGLNRELVIILNDLMPENNSRLHGYNIDSLYGHLNEVMGIKFLSRQGDNVKTQIALPTSEARRTHGGPDAAVPFTRSGERLEYDIDWKMYASSGGSQKAGEVAIVPLCQDELIKMEVPPDLAAVDRPSIVRNVVAYTAGLLRDEVLRSDGITSDESRYLDRVQMRIWNRIIGTARYGHGILDLHNESSE